MQEGSAFGGEQAGDDLKLMVELGVVHDAEDGAAGTGFGVGGGVDEARDARVEDGAGAHGAGFEGGVEGAAVEAVVAQREAGGAQGDDLSVGAGVVVADDAVVAGGEDEAVAHDDRADGDFAGGFGCAGLLDGGLHEGDVGFGVHGLSLSG